MPNGSNGSCTHCPGSHTGQRPCLASATTKKAAGGWLLVEHPGPWGAKLEEMPLPEPVAAAFEAARRVGVRPQLIRRTRRRRATPPLQVYVGRSLGPAPWLEGRELATADELAELDLAAVAAGERAGFGSPVTETLLLVCAHGRHNACCARLGGPLARQLHDRFGDAVWETTHLGGDRYAANLLCLPYGLYYGNLTLDEAVAAAEAAGRGEIVLNRFRGRAGLAEPAQAAEHFLRAHSGVLEVGSVVVESVAGSPVSEAVVRAPGARYRVVVEQVQAAPPCGPDCEERLDTYVLRDLGLLSAATLV